MYSSALFETKVVKDSQGMPSGLEFVGSLAEAQLRKIDALLKRLEPITPEMLVKRDRRMKTNH